MRNFSKDQKLAVEIVTGRKGDGDHIKPYSAGGQTSVENCQLLPRHTNMKKGAFNFKPRGWQVKSPLEQIKRLLPKLSPDERADLLKELL